MTSTDTMTCSTCMTTKPSSEFYEGDLCQDCRRELPNQMANVMLHFTKYCSFCDAYEPLTAFRQKGDGSLLSICVVGERSKRRQRREEGFSDRGFRARWYTAFRDVLRQDSHCTQCGVTAVPFHLLHLDRTTKHFTIGTEALSHDITTLKAEIRKTDVFCQECSQDVQASTSYERNALRKKARTPWADIFASVDAIAQVRIDAPSNKQMTLFA